VPPILFTDVHGDKASPLQSIGDRQIAEIEKVRKLVVGAEGRPAAAHYGDVFHSFESVVFTPEYPAAGRITTPRMAMNSPRTTPRMPRAKPATTKEPDRTTLKTPQTARSGMSTRSRYTIPHKEGFTAPQLDGGIPPTIRRPISRSGSAYIRAAAARSPTNVRYAFEMGHSRFGEVKTAKPESRDSQT